MASHNPNQNQPVICVFCGAQPGDSHEYLTAARNLAVVLHRSNAKLIYGGGTTGLMGELARTLVDLSGASAVQGYIPEALICKHPSVGQSSSIHDSKQAERHISGSETLATEYGNLTVVQDMHTRKKLMAKEVLGGGPGSGFVVLPGGYGTLEELAEITTWNQLGIHDKGIVLLNIGGFWDKIISWIEEAVNHEFIGQGNKGIIVVCKEVKDIMDVLYTYQPSSARLRLTWLED